MRGIVGPFQVEVPWWAEVEPVAAHLEETLGVPVVVLRLLAVEGSNGARDGHVTYHAEALQPTGSLPHCDFIDDDHPLRQPWASASGVRELLRWASRHVDLTGRPVQRKTWNLAGLFRLPTTDGPVWLKAVPAFAAAEPTAIAAFAQVDPDLVPTVLASAPGRLLLADVPGADCWDASPQVVVDAVHRLATAQARIGRPPDDIPDRRPETLAAAVHDLLDGPVGSELSPGELRAARSLQSRWEMLADCGLPDTVVHGDFHPGNWRRGDGPPVILDFADAHLGNPVLDGLRAIDFLPRQPAPRGGRRLGRRLDRHGPPVTSGRGAADRRTAGASRVRRALPGVPRQHRAQRTRLPCRRPGGGDPPGDHLRFCPDGAEMAAARPAFRRWIVRNAV